MMQYNETIEVELLSDPSPQREVITLHRGWTRPSAAIKNVLSLGLRSSQPDDYVIESSTKIPGRMSFPPTKFKCDEKTFDKLYGSDGMPNFLTAISSYDGKNYILENFFINEYTTYSPDKEYECLFDYSREV